jgi:hypothetical protein
MHGTADSRITNRRATLYDIPRREALARWPTDGWWASFDTPAVEAGLIGDQWVIGDLVRLMESKSILDRSIQVA